MSSQQRRIANLLFSGIQPYIREYEKLSGSPFTLIPAKTSKSPKEVLQMKTLQEKIVAWILQQKSSSTVVEGYKSASLDDFPGELLFEHFVFDVLQNQHELREFLSHTISEKVPPRKVVLPHDATPFETKELQYATKCTWKDTLFQEFCPVAVALNHQYALQNQFEVGSRSLEQRLEDLWNWQAFDAFDPLKNNPEGLSAIVVRWLQKCLLEDRQTHVQKLLMQVLDEL